MCQILALTVFEEPDSGVDCLMGVIFARGGTLRPRSASALKSSTFPVPLQPTGSVWIANPSKHGSTNPHRKTEPLSFGSLIHLGRDPFPGVSAQVDPTDVRMFGLSVRVGGWQGCSSGVSRNQSNLSPWHGRRTACHSWWS